MQLTNYLFFAKKAKSTVIVLLSFFLPYIQIRFVLPSTFNALTKKCLISYRNLIIVSKD